MRHRLIFCGLALTPATRALGVFEAAAGAKLVALCSLLLQGFTGDGGAICGAVALATITVAAHENGRTATRAQETSRWWLHRHSCTDEGWAGQRLMFCEILTSATSPSRARGTASGFTCLGFDRCRACSRFIGTPRFYPLTHQLATSATWPPAAITPKTPKAVFALALRAPANTALQ